MKSKHALIALAVFLSSCEFKCSIGKDNGVTSKDTTPRSETSTSAKEKSVPKVTNGIKITGDNVTVHQAYLAMESGSLVPSDNSVALNEKIILTILSEGWKNIDGKSFIGIQQKITTNTGEVVLDTDDMFAKYDATGINAEYTGLLKLTAVITENPAGVDHFITNFRVWDKKGDGEVKGSYKFYVK